jgi:hypothetical protein
MSGSSGSAPEELEKSKVSEQPLRQTPMTSVERKFYRTRLPRGSYAPLIYRPSLAAKVYR